MAEFCFVTPVCLWWLSKSSRIIFLVCVVEVSIYTMYTLFPNSRGPTLAKISAQACYVVERAPPNDYLEFVERQLQMRSLEVSSL